VVFVQSSGARVRKLLCVALLLLSFAGSLGSAQTPPPVPPAPPIPPTPTSLAISGPSSVAVYELAKFTVTGGTVTSVAWDVTPPASTDVVGQQLDVTGKPQDYVVTAFVASNGQLSILKANFTIEAPKILAIAIFDPSTLTSLPAGQAAIYQSSTLADSLRLQGVTYLQYQMGDTVQNKGGSIPLSQTTWGQQAVAAGLPALVTQVGGTISAVPLPASQAEILQQYFDRKGK
jgi:hypothetical protein